MNIEQNFETIKFSLNDHIGLVEINRESKYNALNSKVLDELTLLFDQIRLDEEYKIKGLILTGRGDKAFIAGADISQMSSMSEKEGKDFGELGQNVSFLIEDMKIPVIACVNGFALGGGCEMALSCDFIYATQNAVFGLPEVKLGLIPGYGGTQRLAKIVGRNKAKEMIFTGRNVDANEALQMGLVLKIFENKEQMLSEAKKTLELCFANSPLAISTAKKVLNKGVDYGNREGLKLELENFAKIFTSEDMKEGTKAFTEKRAPKFTGK